MKSKDAMKLDPARTLLLALACLAAVACRTAPPARYFLLSPEAVAVTKPSAASGLTLGIGPIDWPPYLDRPQIVVRRGGTEVELSEQHLWAEPLDHNFVAALADHVAARSGSDDVLAFPWPASSQLDRRVRGEVLRFDVDEAGQALLIVRWQLEDTHGTVLMPFQRSRYTHSATSDDIAALVEALAATVAAFGDDLAAAMEMEAPGGG